MADTNTNPTINKLISDINTSKSYIRTKFIEMGLKDSEGNDITQSSNLATVADAAKLIEVNDSTSKIVVTPDNKDSAILAAGVYYKNGVQVTYNADDQYTANGATPVYASHNQDNTYYAEQGTLIEEFTVKKIPVANQEVYLTDIKATEDDGQGNTITVKAPDVELDGELRTQYMTEVKVPKVLIGTFDVDYDRLYNGSTDDYEVTTAHLQVPEDADWEWTGLSKVTIPRPVVEDHSTTVDLLSLDGTADKIVTLPAAFIKESYITIETKELYDALAAI